MSTSLYRPTGLGALNPRPERRGTPRNFGRARHCGPRWRVLPAPPTLAAEGADEQGALTSGGKRDFARNCGREHTGVPRSHATAEKRDAWGPLACAPETEEDPCCVWVTTRLSSEEALPA